MKPSGTKLQKSITWLEGSAMTVAAVVGTGVLILPGLAAQLAGPASLLAWLAMGILIIPMAVTLGMLAARMPDAGGIAAYARRAFGRRAGAVTGWLYLGTVPIGAPIAALIGVSYIGTVIDLSPLAGCMIAALMIAASALLNMRGIQLAGWVQTGIVAAILLILVSAIAAAFPHVSGEAFRPFAPNGYLPAGSALTVLFWAFVGWEMMSHLTEEFHNPRHVMTSVWVTIVLVNVIYFGVAFVTVGTGVYRGDNPASLAGLIGYGWGKQAGAIVGVLGFLLSFGSIHTYFAGFSRLIYAQALNGDFPRYFGTLHARFATPHRALAAVGGAGIAVLLAAYALHIDLVPLMQLPSSVFICLYVVAMAAGVKLARGLLSPKLKRLSFFGLILCLAIVPFAGWVILYPAAIAGIGYWYSRKQAAKIAVRESMERLQ
ncbi:amino acid permease [Paenibacillus sp. MBLB4367]|uniref:amino acid permease n=1 Tax=Paenibacillus sp. MBLB4367 TaxID=3384767 RepID=UPI003908272F